MMKTKVNVVYSKEIFGDLDLKVFTDENLAEEAGYEIAIEDDVNDYVGCFEEMVESLGRYIILNDGLYEYIEEDFKHTDMIDGHIEEWTNKWYVKIEELDYLDDKLVVENGVKYYLGGLE